MTGEASASVSTGMPAGVQRHRDERIEHWNGVALSPRPGATWGAYYHQRVRDLYRFRVPAGQRVLELGCGQGNLLASLQPSYGVGVDFAEEMLARARTLHPELHFVSADAHEWDAQETFDVVILSDLINDAWDVQTILDRVSRACTPRTRLIVNSYSRLWEPFLAVASALGFAQPTLRQNWLSASDVAGLLDLANFELIQSSREILWPVGTPLIAGFFNKVLVHLPFIRSLALTTFFVARKRQNDVPAVVPPTVSIIVPVRNEAGNIPALFQRTPEMGSGVELIFVEGHSRDDSWDAINREMAAHPERTCRVFRQSGVGKGDAVRLGFAEAKGELLMILDADLTMPPEELPRFFDLLYRGKAEFANGVRLVYPMEGEAMPFLNLIGNHFFSGAFSWILGQPVKDTLCGTKVLWAKDYRSIAANRAYFGEFDPFGDFDLLFGAAKMSLKISDVPVRYRERVYGSTNIQRWRHGVLLMRMTWFALWRLKLV
jgi:SAM-dependent methyltransferase